MLKLTLVTPEKIIVVDRDISGVVIPAYAGELGILEGHAPLITTLDSGILSYIEEGTAKEIVVSGGYCEVYDNHVKVLAEKAETREDISLEDAKALVQKLKAALDDVSSVNYDAEKLIPQLKHAEARLTMASSSLK